MADAIVEKSTHVRLTDGREGVVTGQSGDDLYQVRLCGGAGEILTVPWEDIKEVIQP